MRTFLSRIRGLGEESRFRHAVKHAPVQLNDEDEIDRALARM